ncbi:carboxylesterase family protein [Novosphingobium flavum]|uniref:Carboxylesterase family protein n=1 Tax=Novosphingobium flavum TaxID=1778672 RepID=A0A7X1FS57_9SPHN|nr:carboxylesterase family protein [Novosphingobium flavum]MBC2665362.1 carboxylesterase family protein [Novosphingobium flavum]
MAATAQIGARRVHLEIGRAGASSARRRVIISILGANKMKRLIGLLPLTFGLMVPASAMAAITGPVRIEGGPVRGTTAGEPQVSVFWGLPYAAAPVGPMRFRPPQPVKGWRGTRSAERPGPICPQVFKQNIAGMKIDEDCLNLDVWTAASSGRERRPVMVWFHGGTRGAGASSDPIFNGAALAKKGVVVVVVNYRGGPLGLLATPELSRESGHAASGNYGLMDNIAALKWVQRNIAAFGGDPARVTIFGESFGAGIVNFLSLTPMTKGLFKRQITQSHALYPRDPVLLDNATRYIPSLAEAEAAGTKFMEVVGAKSTADLRAMPWPKLYEGFTKTFNLIPWAFNIDGYVLPRNFTETYAAGTHADVEALTGENRDENGGAPDTAFDFVAAGKGKPPANTISLRPLPDYLAFVDRKYGPMKDEFLRHYPAGDPREAFQSSNRAIRDNSQISPWMWAHSFTGNRKKPVFVYMFTKAPPGPDRDMVGAYHGADVRYVFNNPLPDWNSEDRRVADMMSSYWVNFARTGNPNGPGLPAWRAYDGNVRQTMELGGRFGPMPFPDPKLVDFWQRFYASQPAR